MCSSTPKSFPESWRVSFRNNVTRWETSRSTRLVGESTIGRTTCDRSLAFAAGGSVPIRPARLSGDRLRGTMAASPGISKGLDHVVVDRSSISWVGGETGDLVYRGFDVRDLVPGIPYESAVHLILFGEPPSRDPSPEVAAALRDQHLPPTAVEKVVDALAPTLPPLEALRTILSALGDGSFGYPPRMEEGFRLIAQTPVLLARHVRRSKGLAPIAPGPTSPTPPTTSR